MTAAIAPLQPQAAGHRPLRSHPVPPVLRVVHGGGLAPVASAVLWRRRAVALALTTVLVVVTWWGISAALRPLLGSPEGGRSTPGPAEAQLSQPSDATVYVVQPGDTLASVAQQVDPGAPWQHTASTLVARNGLAPGDTTLHPGQRLLLG
jgi:hypothetical protein